MIKKRSVILIIAIITVVFLMVIFKNSFFEIISLVISASIIAYLIYPLIKHLEKRVNRNLAIFLGFLLIFASIFSIISLLVPVFIGQIKNLMFFLPDYIEKIKNYIAEIPYLNNLISGLDINEKLTSGTSELFLKVSPQNILSFLSSLLLVPVIVFYMLKEREKIKSISLFLLPTKMRTPSIYIFRDINRQLRDYIVGEFIIIITVSFLMALLLAVFGFEYWLILGIIMGVFNIIPYIGPIIGSLPILLTAFSENKIILALILIIAVQQIDNLIIHPRIISDSVKIHPVIVLLCVVAGSSVGNILGMVLAIPAFIIFRILFKEFYKYFSERKRNFPQFSKI